MRVREASKWDVDRTYRIEGTLLNSESKSPIKNIPVAISQKKDGYDEYEASDYTDLEGKFAIDYKPTKSEEYGLKLHIRADDYRCALNIDILNNIEKGKNINLGKVYTRLIIAE